MRSGQFSVLANYWGPYIPSASAPWNLRRVVHLHRRAGFAATWSELQRDLKDGPKISIDRLIKPGPQRQGMPTDFATTSAMLVDRAATDGDINRLKACRIYRMLFPPDPPRPPLPLLWHNH